MKSSVANTLDAAFACYVHDTDFEKNNLQNSCARNSMNIKEML